MKVGLFRGQYEYISSTKDPASVKEMVQWSLKVNNFITLSCYFRIMEGFRTPKIMKTCS